MTRKFFQIGFNKCATTFIARIFQMNAIPTIHWAEGALAEDIAYSRQAGRKPLQQWANEVVAFTDMESVRYLNMPVVEAFQDYEFLDRSFPGAVFMLNTRNVEDWVISRYMHRGGSYARAYAQILGVGLADLADIWAESWHRHHEGVRAYFAGRPEFIEIDIDTARPEDYRAALAPFFDLPLCPQIPAASVRKTRESYLPRLAKMLAEPVQVPVAPAERDHVLAQLNAAARPARITDQGRPDIASGLFAAFDVAAQAVRDRNGQPLPLLRGESGKYHLDPARLGLLRVAATVNDIAEFAAGGTYRMDMTPACRMGCDETSTPPWPVIAASRRAGAANVFLWPAPWIHRLGNDGYLGAPGRLDPAFEHKRDRAVWRGRLTGYALVDGAHDLDQPVEPALATLRRADTSSPTFSHARDTVRHAARYGFALAHAASDDVDAALLPDEATGNALLRAGLSQPFARGHDDSFILSHRYVICLGGVAGADALLPMLNSHSVVLKEEDGWEHFASALFQPWQHYIPLKAGAADLDRQLAWARVHPDACQEMSARSRELCRVLADPECRRQHLTQVLRDYRRASGQD